MDDAFIVLASVEEVKLFDNQQLFNHRKPTQSVCVADYYFIVNVLDLPFVLPLAIYQF